MASQSQAKPIDNRADNASFWRVELNRVGMPREVGRQNEAHSQDNAVLLAWSAYLFAASAGGILGLNVSPGPEKHTVEATVEELELAERMEGSLLRGEWRAACGVLRAAGEIPGALFRFHYQDNGTCDNGHLRSLHGRIVAVINCMRLFWGRRVAAATGGSGGGGDGDAGGIAGAEGAVASGKRTLCAATL